MFDEANYNSRKNFAFFIGELSATGTKDPYLLEVTVGRQHQIHAQWIKKWLVFEQSWVSTVHKKNLIVHHRWCSIQSSMRQQSQRNSVSMDRISWIQNFFEIAGASNFVCCIICDEQSNFFCNHCNHVSILYPCHMYHTFDISRNITNGKKGKTASGLVRKVTALFKSVARRNEWNHNDGTNPCIQFP